MKSDRIFRIKQRGFLMLRRTLFLSAATSILALSARIAYAQEGNDIEIIGNIPALPNDLKDFSHEPPAPYTELSAVGTGQPLQEEIQEASEILRNSPYNTSHVDVANYFLSLSGTKAQYRREWPVRANPVIYHFFSATQTRPEGDTTAWCAAALNWFLLRSRATQKDEIGKSPGQFSKQGLPFTSEALEKFSTRSAASGSFRCLKETQTPQLGDIVVLANKGTESLTKYCRGQGHVAIFLKSIGSDRVEVLGGNQSEQGSNGAITKASLKIGAGSRFLKFIIPPGLQK